MRMQEVVGDLLDLHPFVCNEISSLGEYVGYRKIVNCIRYYDLIRKTMGEESVYLEWHVQDSRGEPLLNYENCFLLPSSSTRDLRVMVFVMYEISLQILTDVGIKWESFGCIVTWKHVSH
jgi:hypothetical protein